MKLSSKSFAILAVITYIASYSLLALPFHAQAQSQTGQAVMDAHYYGSTVELHINDRGDVTLNGARVEAVAGTTFYTKIYWGQMYLRLTVRGTDTTQYTKKFGGAMSASQVSVGDYISVAGNFVPNTNVFDMTASTIKDWSVQTTNDEYSGTVSALSDSGFTLTRSKQASINVSIGTTTQITKGNLTIALSQIKIGDKVVSADGSYDHLTNTLAAAHVVIYQDMNVFTARNFQGKIQSVTGTTPPLQVNVSVNENGVSKNYIVNVTGNTQVLNANKANASIARFLPGDTVRFYGNIRESNQSMIDNVEVIRNLDL